MVGVTFEYYQDSSSEFILAMDKIQTGSYHASYRRNWTGADAVGSSIISDWLPRYKGWFMFSSTFLGLQALASTYRLEFKSGSKSDMEVRGCAFHELFWLWCQLWNWQIFRRWLFFTFWERFNTYCNMEDENQTVTCYTVSQVLSQSLQMVKAEAQAPNVSSRSNRHLEDDYFSCS